MSDVPTQVRSTVLNLDSGKGIYFQYEPPNIGGAASANYNSDPALGGTHENATFSHTSNETFNLELRWNRITLTALTGKTTEEGSAVIDQARAFIRSLLNPVRLAVEVAGGDTPLLFLSVPGVLAVYARLRSIDWEVPRRDPATGQIMELTMRCTFAEEPQYRYTADDIAEVGYNRS